MYRGGRRKGASGGSSLPTDWTAVTGSGTRMDFIHATYGTVVIYDPANGRIAFQPLGTAGRHLAVSYDPDNTGLHAGPSLENRSGGATWLNIIGGTVGGVVIGGWDSVGSVYRNVLDVIAAAGRPSLELGKGGGDILIGLTGKANNSNIGDLRVPRCVGTPTGVPQAGGGCIRQSETDGKFYGYNQVTAAWEAFT